MSRSISVTYAGRKLSTSPKLHRGAWPGYAGCSTIAAMAVNHYLKEWRKHSGLTQEQVVGRLEAFDDTLLPTTAASLSRLENGKQPYSERVLEALADVYNTTPGHLLENNPDKEGEVIDFIARLNAKQRQQVIAFVTAITADG